MSMLDGLLGGLVSAGVTALVNQVIQQHGGVQGLVSAFEQKGLGGIAQSWVSTGTNQPIDANQIAQILGSDTIRGLSEKLGIPVEKIATNLAQHLPAAVDKLTPNGALPAAA